MNEFDDNKSGFVSFKEFCNLMKTLQWSWKLYQ